MKRRLLPCLVIFVLMFGAQRSWGAVITYDWTGALSTDWSTPGNWKIGAAIATTTPGSVSTDAVQIGVVSFSSGNQPVLNTGATITIGSLTIGSATVSTLTINSALTVSVAGAGTGITTVNSGCTVITTAVFTTATLTVTGSTFTLGAQLNITANSNSALTFSSGTTTINATSSLIDETAGGMLMSGGTVTLGAPLSATAGTVTITGTLNINAAFTTTTIAVNSGSTITTNSSGIITGTTLTVTGSTFNLGAQLNITSGSNSALTFSSGTTVFNTTSSLISEGSGGGVLLSSGTVTLGAPLSSPGNPVNITGTLNVNAAFASGAITINSGGSITSTTGGTIGATTLAITSGTLSLGGTVTLTGTTATTLNFASGTSFVTGSASITESGSGGGITLATGTTVTLGVPVIAASLTVTNSTLNLNALITLTGTTSTSLNLKTGGNISITGTGSINGSGGGGLSVNDVTTLGVPLTCGAIAVNSNFTTNTGAIITGTGITLGGVTVTLNDRLNISGMLTTAGSHSLATNASGNTISGGLKLSTSDVLNWNGSGTTLVSGTSTMAGKSVLTVGSGNTVTFNAISMSAGSATGPTLTTISNNGTISCNGAVTLVNYCSIANAATFNLGPLSVITLNGNTSTIISNTGTFTLQSDATGSASIATIAANNGSFTGNFNVQRYMGGGAGHRTYRFVSSPVNQGVVTGKLSGALAYGFTALQATTPITGYTAVGSYTSATVPTNAFDPSPSGNPSVLYYNEPDADPPNTVIANSDYRGISTINEELPIGNAFLFFFRGNRNVNDAFGANKATTAAIPENTTLNFTGALNQGTVNVSTPSGGVVSSGGHYVYVTPTTAITTLTYTNHSSSPDDGYHLIGNPYASTIDLDASGFLTVGGSTGLGSSSIYMLNNVGIMGAYVLGTHTSSNGVGEYVLSGQGFFVRGNNTGAGTTTVSFPETCKVNGLSLSSTIYPFALKIPQVPAAKSTNTATSLAVNPSVQQNLHINLLLDSFNYNETVILFGAKTQNKYNPFEDAYYNYGLSQTTFMASYTSDNQPCLVNQMGSLDSIKTIALYAEGQTTGTYTMTFSGASTIDPAYKLYLMDNLLKDSLDLSANSVYTFKIDRSNAQSYGASRFTLVVHPTGIANYYLLLAFNGIKNNNSVSLNWTTQYEGDYTGFTLQRSTDNWKTYTVIDTLQSNGTGAYSYTDANPVMNGINQYRLVQNNVNAVNSFSNIVTISYQPVNSITTGFEIYPNPAVSTIQVKLKNTNTANALYIKVYNMDGSLVLNNKVSAGNAVLSQDVSSLLKGTYVIDVTDSDNKNYGAATFTKL